MVKKKYIVTFLLMLIACAALFLAACGNTEKQESGAEVGAYYNDDSGNEYLISLKEQGNVEFKVDGTDSVGTYQLDGKNLTITLDGRDEKIEAEYSERTIRLTFNEKELVFLEKIEYTVTFETDGGSSIDSVKVLNGKHVARPSEDPTKKNHEFIDWYTSKEGDTLFVFETVAITENTTVYAKWERLAERNTLTYDQTSAKTETPSCSVIEGETFVLEIPENPDTNDTVSVFMGWYTAKDGKGDRLTDGTGASLGVWEAKGDITVYAYFALPFTYAQLDDGTWAVSGNDETKSFTELNIPAYYEGKAVTKVGAFEGHVSVVRVSIPATVREISETAFNNSPLIEVFEVTEVEGVKAVYSAEKGVLYSDNGNTLVRYPIAKKDSDGMPETSFTVPSYVTKIAPYAFADIAKVAGGMNQPGTYYGTLTEITLPDNLVEIGDYAFCERQKMTSIHFGSPSASGVHLTIGKYAFAYIWITKDLDLPSNLIELQEGAFAGDSSAIHSMVLDGGEDELILPEGLRSIGAKAFENNVWITKVTIPSTVTSIGADAFSGCSSYMAGDWKYHGGIKEIVFSSGSKLETIGDGAFSGINGITEVELPASLKYLGADAFSGCSTYSISYEPSYHLVYTGLTSITLHEGLQSIGDNAFSSCRALTEVNIPASVTSFGTGVFNGCSALTIEGISIPANSKVLSTDGHAVFDKEKTKLMLYPKANTATHYKVPDSVENIESYAFYGNDTLQTIDLPSGLKYIGEYAFAESSLKSVTIPEGITAIYSHTFYNTYDLEYVYIPASVTEIGEGAFDLAGLNQGISLRVEFAENSLLTTIGDEAFSNRKITSIDLPEGLLTIGNEAFSGNDFTEIVLPDGIYMIGDDAFRSCQNLKTVTLPSDLRFLGLSPFGYCGSLKEIIISDNEYFKAIDGNLYSADGTKLIQYAIGKTDDAFAIPETVTEIGDDAFANALNLKTVTISENVTAVGNGVWSGKFVTEPSWGYLGTEVFVIDSQAFLNLFGRNTPTSMDAATTFYVREDLVIPESATYFTDALEKQETSDRDGYVKYIVKD